MDGALRSDFEGMRDGWSLQESRKGILEAVVMTLACISNSSGFS